MDTTKCSEFGATVNDRKGNRLAARRRFRSYAAAREWAQKTSTERAVDGADVAEIVVLGYASIGDPKPATREVTTYP